MAKKLPDLKTGIAAYLAGADEVKTVPPSGPKAAELAVTAPPKKQGTKTPAAKPSPEKKAARAPNEEKPAKPKMPWDDIDPTIMQPFSTRISAQLYEQMQHVATHKYNITHIVNDALREKVAKMLKERGIG